MGDDRSEGGKPRRRGWLAALVAGLCASISASASADSITSVSYQLEVGDVAGLEFSETQHGFLTLDFSADRAGNVVAGPVSVREFSIGFAFQGNHPSAGLITGTAYLTLMEPLSGWSLQPDGSFLSPITAEVAALFDGHVSYYHIFPEALNHWDMAPQATFFDFLNGNPFSPGALGNPAEVQASFDVVLTQDNGSTVFENFDFGGRGNESARAFSSAPAPGAPAQLVLGLCAIALLRFLRRSPVQIWRTLH